MSNIDKRALREAAERAGQNDWEYVYTSDLSAPGRGYITVGGAEAIYCLNRATGGVKQSENVLRYIAAARPEKMLALLDELEAAEKRIAELSHHLQCAHAFIEHTEAFGHAASNGILCCGDVQWNIDESKSALAAAGKGE